MPIIGIDVGGSHISSAAVHEDTLTLIDGTYFKGSIDSKASKEAILKGWADIINQTLSKVDSSDTVGIGFSMPGPFKYETGVAMFKGNDKYESLYEVHIPNELGNYLNHKNVTFKFLNDASCFGIGSALALEGGSTGKKVIAVTLGTGFGASFLNDTIPVTKHPDVPENGCLWDKPFNNSIADNYFSTRWFTSTYEQYSGNKVNNGVKEIAELNNHFSSQLFEEFSINLSSFLLPYIQKFDADTLVLGGNIARCHGLFLPGVIAILEEKSVKIAVDIAQNTEEASIKGAAYLFNTEFFKKIAEELPNF